MIRRLALALAFILSSVSAVYADAATVLTPHGMGALQIGMTLEETFKTAGEKIALEENPASATCIMGDLPAHPGLGILLENGKIARITATAPWDEKDEHFTTPGNYVTAEGIRLGDDETKIKNVYKKSVTIEDHIYDDNGHFLKVKNADGFGYMFETHDGKVIDIHAGQYPAVGYPEGCL